MRSWLLWFGVKTWREGLRGVVLDELEVLFSDREQVKFLAIVIGNLDQLCGAVVAEDRSLSACGPSPDRALQRDDVVFDDFCSAVAMPLEAKATKT
jgi:hypothetical protein